MFSRKTVMVVEDQELNRVILSQILSSDYEVVEAENGVEALDKLKEFGAGISLILLDIVMPIMDGYEFLSIIKADAVYSSIPVVVMTQNDSEADEMAALSRGAADFVGKPYSAQIVLRRVANIINMRETAAVMNIIKYDRLTGLYSKAFFCQQVKEVMSKNPDKKYDMICSNIENFKLVNDVFGNQAGDKLLINIADTYRAHSDENSIYGRLDSDHFAYFTERIETYSNDLFKDKSINIRQLFMNTGNFVIRWGIYRIDNLELSAEQICDRALLAVQNIKGQYGKYFAYYDDELRVRMLREQSITECMEEALRDEQFIVYLQPKYRTHDEVLVGAEALVRWIHPKWGFQSPAEFIPVFEKNGFITKLDQYVWDKTCSILKDWEDRGFAPIPVSVNVSRADVYNVDLPNILTNILSKYGLPPSRLHLEITESLYTDDAEQIISVISTLRNMGFVIEMDDFGSGYSSLNMLNSMPIDIIKLDMGFVRSETAKPGRKGILKFVIELAHWMDLSITAEGVETISQLEILKEMGCDYIQGYYFSKPVPQKDFELFFDNCTTEVSEPEIYPYGLVHFDHEYLDNKRHVMIVADEDGDYAQNVKEMFDNDFEVVYINNGREVINYLYNNKDCVEMIILSMTMRDEDGTYVLEKIKSADSFKLIPVIACAYDNDTMEEMALSLNANDFIKKPYTKKSMTERMKRVLTSLKYRRRNEIFSDVSCRDYLTGLLNSNGFNEALNLIKNETSTIGVCVFDIDNMESCNQKYGVSYGDELMVHFSMILRSYAGVSDVIARLGGDEFVVVMRDIKSPEVVLKFGNKVCKAVKKITKFEVSCSAGAAFTQSGEAFSKLIDRAEHAVYDIKRTKEGSCCLLKG